MGEDSSWEHVQVNHMDTSSKDKSKIHKFFPSRTPTKNEIVFAAPTGEKIHTRRHMEKYLKENSGPKISKFDWGKGETPRRSTRIIDKAKAAPLVEHQSEPPKKQGKKSATYLKAHQNGRLMTRS
ncbi:methyl-CpG-binding domain protein [Medicago truncatula]|uniref:Methyl-CpG-binding domain protein n=1 Tax=Medicago truncatula TaxID=3880 RepID=G7KL39_MEDTR|nr:methyl-CpG-binding domain protein [Medicago truncatula]